MKKQDKIDFQYLGENQQILQILIHQNQSVITKPNNLLYSSSQLKIQAYAKYPFNIFEKFFGEKSLVADQLKLEIVNQSEEIGYIGLSRASGKILTLNQQLFDNYIIKEKIILAMTQQANLNLNYQQNIKQLMPDKWCQLKNQQSNQDEFVFCQTQGIIIEKELGEGEIMLLKAESLIIYQNTVRLQMVNYTQAYGNNNLIMPFNNKFNNQVLQITGPGTIFIENTIQNIPSNQLANNRMMKMIGIFILINIIWILIELVALNVLDHELFE